LRSCAAVPEINPRAYPRYRLLVTDFIEKKGWSVDQLLQTRLTADEAAEIMSTDEKR